MESIHRFLYFLAKTLHPRARGESDQQIYVVGLNLRGICRLVADGRAALLAAVDYDISLLRVGKHLYGAQKPKTVVCAVAGVYVYVYGMKAFRAMIAGCDAQGLYFEAAMSAYESAVIFLKTFFFHILSPIIYFE